MFDSSLVFVDAWVFVMSLIHVDNLYIPIADRQCLPVRLLLKTEKMINYYCISVLYHTTYSFHFHFRTKAVPVRHTAKSSAAAEAKKTNLNSRSNAAEW